MKKRFNIATIIGLMLLSAVVAFTITYLTVEKHFEEQLVNEQSRNEELNKIIKVFNTIESDYVGDYEQEDLIDGAVYGIIAGMGDRWSFYMDKEAFSEYQNNINNQYVGIGVTVAFLSDENVLVVTRVHSGSAAEASGIRYKDKIFSVDGELVADIGYDETVARVRGAEDTPVTLGIKRGNEELNVQVVRKSYLYNAVSSQILSNNLGYIKIDNFDSRVDVNFEDALKKLLDANITGLIFDVRGNPGGMKDTMVSMLDILCPEGVLFKMRDKHGAEVVDRSDANEVNLPMVVIVNENSYSAAEFFAVALQEYDKADIIGTGTSGKGYSQVTKALGDGTAINLSTNEYFTPTGKSLIGVGLTPDHFVESNPDVNFMLLEPEEDTQLQKAIEVLLVKISQLES